MHQTAARGRDSASTLNYSMKFRCSHERPPEHASKQHCAMHRYFLCAANLLLQAVQRKSRGDDAKTTPPWVVLTPGLRKLGISCSRPTVLITHKRPRYGREPSASPTRCLRHPCATVGPPRPRRNLFPKSRNIIWRYAVRELAEFATGLPTGLPWLEPALLCSGQSLCPIDAVAETKCSAQPCAAVVQGGTLRRGVLKETLARDFGRSPVAFFNPAGGLTFTMHHSQ